MLWENPKYLPFCMVHFQLTWKVLPCDFGPKWPMFPGTLLGASTWVSIWHGSRTCNTTVGVQWSTARDAKKTRTSTTGYELKLTYAEDIMFRQYRNQFIFPSPTEESETLCLGDYAQKYVCLGRKFAIETGILFHTSSTLNSAIKSQWTDEKWRNGDTLMQNAISSAAWSKDYCILTTIMSSVIQVPEMETNLLSL